MRLYEINLVDPNALVAITLESGKHICCPVKKLYKSYTESPSKNRLKRDGHITSVVFYNTNWTDVGMLTTPLPLEEADFDSGMYISPEDFTNILKYILKNVFHFCNEYDDVFPVIDFIPNKSTAREKKKLYETIKKYCDMPIEEFNSYENPFIDCCDCFLELLYDKHNDCKMFAMLLKAKELTI